MIEAVTRRNTLLSVLGISIGALLFVAFDVLLGGPFTTSIDPAVDDWISANASADVQNGARDYLSLPGGAFAVIVGLGVGMFAALDQRRASYAVVQLVTVVVGVAGYKVLKIFFGRTRPTTLIDTYAFPSGHVTMVVLVWGLVFALFLQGPSLSRSDPGDRQLSRWLAYGAAGWITMVLLVGVGRLVGRVHWLSDVVGGLFLGLALLSGALLFVGRRRRSKPWAVETATPSAAAAST